MTSLIDYQHILLFDLLRRVCYFSCCTNTDYVYYDSTLFYPFSPNNQSRHILCFHFLTLISSYFSIVDFTRLKMVKKKKEEAIKLEEQAKEEEAAAAVGQPKVAPKSGNTKSLLGGADDDADVVFK